MYFPVSFEVEVLESWYQLNIEMTQYSRVCMCVLSYYLSHSFWFLSFEKRYKECVLLKLYPCMRQKDGRRWDKAENQMTQGYLISSRALEIGVRLWCQRLHTAFISLAQNLFTQLFLSDCKADAIFKSRPRGPPRRERRKPPWNRSRPVWNTSLGNVTSSPFSLPPPTLLLLLYTCSLILSEIYTFVHRRWGRGGGGRGGMEMLCNQRSISSGACVWEA